jgi:hypothetical protein
MAITVQFFNGFFNHTTFLHVDTIRYNELHDKLEENHAVALKMIDGDKTCLAIIEYFDDCIHLGETDGEFLYFKDALDTLCTAIALKHGVGQVSITPGRPAIGRFAVIRGYIQKGREYIKNIERAS